MSSSQLEDLPNEVLGQILLNLSLTDLLHGWWDINSRFKTLIFSLSYNVYLTKKDISMIDIEAILVLRQRIAGLAVRKKWCGLIHHFTNLRSLQVFGFAYPFSISQVGPSILPQLTRIEYGLDDLNWDRFMGADDCYYARQLVRCYIRKLVANPSISSQVLNSLKINLCTSEQLALLLRLCPNLVDIDIGLYKEISIDFGKATFLSISITTKADEHPSFSPTPTNHFEDILHPQLRRIALRFNPETTLKWLDTFLVCTPNVTHFSLDISRSYNPFSFIKFHHIITQRLVNLIPQKFRFKYCCLPKEFDLYKHRNIGSLFKTMVSKSYSSHQVNLLIISVNWKNNNQDNDDDYDDDDDDDDDFQQ